jgi:hypothetical protein
MARCRSQSRTGRSGHLLLDFLRLILYPANSLLNLPFSITENETVAGWMTNVAVANGATAVVGTCVEISGVGSAAVGSGVALAVGSTAAIAVGCGSAVAVVVGSNVGTRVGDASASAAVLGEIGTEASRPVRAHVKARTLRKNGPTRRVCRSLVYELPSALEQAIARFVEYYNERRYHEGSVQSRPNERLGCLRVA